MMALLCVGLAEGYAAEVSTNAAPGVSSPKSSRGTNDLELTPENPSLWKESFLWDKAITLRGGFGYKDNVLLSPTAPQGSGFFTSGMDLLVFRLPLNGLDVNLSASGDYVRYFRTIEGLNTEGDFLADLHVAKEVAADWHTGMDLKYLYLNQVQQELVATGGVAVVLAKGNTLGFSPYVRRELGSNWWGQVQFNGDEEWWQSPLDDQTKFGGLALAGFTHGQSEFTLGFGISQIDHHEWLAREADGEEIPGELLVMFQRGVDLRWDQTWDRRGYWNTTTKLGFLYNEDNGGGYFNYYRYQASEEARFMTRQWEARASASVSYYDFPVQTATSSLPPPDFSPQPPTPPQPAPKLRYTSLVFSFRLERAIWKALRAFGEYRYERVLSDAPDIEYTANTAAGGLSWEF